MAPGFVPPGNLRPELEALVGGPEKAAAIRRILSGTPTIAGGKLFSCGGRAGHFLRRFPEFSPTPPRARELYRHVADLTKLDAAGRPKPVSITHRKLAVYLHCGIRAVGDAVRQLARTGLFPLLAVTPGRTGRASRFLFVCDPFAFAETQAAEAARVRSRRQPRTVSEQAQAIMAEHSAQISPARSEQLQRYAQRKREWNLPPAEGRVARFKQRLG
jgi:hypothetical protein